MSRVAPDAANRNKESALAQPSFKQYRPVHKFSAIKEGDAPSIASLSTRSIDSDFSSTFTDGKKKEDSVFNGYRQYTWKNGDEFQGTWRHNQMHGRGLFKCKEGEYQGEFYEHRMQGFGKFKYSSGGAYVGEFVAGKRDGRGVFAYSEDCIYEGEFVAGVPNGKGTMLYANGDVYTGEWLNSTQHGAGIYESRHAGVEIFRGNFVEGRRDGRGEVWIISQQQVLTRISCILSVGLP